MALKISTILSRVLRRAIHDRRKPTAWHCYSIRRELPGLKKGVRLTFRQIAAQVAAYVPTIQLSESSTLVSWLPLYHDMGLFTAFIIPMTVGATVVSIDPFEWVRQPPLLLELIERFHGSRVFMPNFAFNHIVNSTPPDAHYDLRSMIAFFSCSEPVKPASFDYFLNQFTNSGVDATKLQTCYAMAEACFPFSNPAWAAVSCVP